MVTEGGAGGSESTQGGSAAGGTAGTAGASGEGGAPGECTANIETTVGPFPNISPLNRKDMRGNTTGNTTAKAGALLTLRVRVLDLDAFCAPVEGVVVDIWQCDAVGNYAGYSAFSTVGEDFCRGYQATNAQGVAEFITIFPGSYSGRAIHIHFSLRAAEGTLAPNASGQNLADIFVAQIYFEDDVAAEIFEAFPIYQQGAAITPNAADGIFGSGGIDLIVEMTKNGASYIGDVDVGVHRSAIGL